MTPRLEDLAESLKPIAEHFGVEAAEKVVEHFGGTELWVPKMWREGHPLNVLGVGLAKDLCRVFGGEHLPIPKELVTAETRHRRAVALAAEGKTTAQIARELNLTERHVYKLLASSPQKAKRGRPVDERQFNLLDRLSGD